jgi:hypothetical protein
MELQDNSGLFAAFLATAGDEQLRRFLVTHIRAPQALRILLLLREHRRHPVSPALVSDVLGVGIDEAFDELEALCERGLALFCPGEDSRAYVYLAQGITVEDGLDRISCEDDCGGFSTVTMLSSRAIAPQCTSIAYTFERLARSTGESAEFRVRSHDVSGSTRNSASDEGQRPYAE